MFLIEHILISEKKKKTINMVHKPFMEFLSEHSWVPWDFL